MAKWKFEPGDRVIANEKAPIDYEGLSGVVVERGPSKAEYGVRIDGRETTEYLNSWWLQPSTEPPSSR